MDVAHAELWNHFVWLNARILAWYWDILGCTMHNPHPDWQHLESEQDVVERRIYLNSATHADVNADDDRMLLVGVYSSWAYANFNFIFVGWSRLFKSEPSPRGDSYPKNKQSVFIPFSAKDRRVFTGLRETEKDIRESRESSNLNSCSLKREGSYRNKKEEVKKNPALKAMAQKQETQRGKQRQ